MISSIIAALFIKIQPNMSKQEKKWQRIYDLLNAETKLKHGLPQAQTLSPLITLYGAF